MQDSEQRKRRNWAESLVAGTAFAVSVISLVLALRSEHTQERMLQASSFPILEFRTGNQGDDGRLRIGLAVKNSGTGPARIRHASVRWHGKAAHGWLELMTTCCSFNRELASRTAARALDADAGSSDFEWASNPLAPLVLPAGETVSFFTLRLAESTRPYWEKLDRARFELEFDVCYCSVLDECWHSDLRGGDPRHVDRCPADGGTSYRE